MGERISMPASPAGHPGLVEAKPTIVALRCLYSHAWPPHIIAELAGTKPDRISELVERDLRRPGTVDAALAAEIERIALCVKSGRWTVAETARQLGHHDLAAIFRRVAPCHLVNGPCKDTSRYAYSRKWRTFAAIEPDETDDESETTQAVPTLRIGQERARQRKELRQGDRERYLEVVRAEEEAKARLRLEVLDGFLRGHTPTSLALRHNLKPRTITRIRQAAGLRMRNTVYGTTTPAGEEKRIAQIRQVLKEFKDGRKTVLEAAREIGFTVAKALDEETAA